MQTDLATSWLEIRLFGRALFGLGILYRHRLTLRLRAKFSSRGFFERSLPLMLTDFSPRTFLVQQLSGVLPAPLRTAACVWSRRSKSAQEALLRMPKTLKLGSRAWEFSEMHLLHVKKPEQLRPLLLPLLRHWLQLQLWQQLPQLLQQQLEQLLLSLLHWLQQQLLQQLLKWETRMLA